MESGLPVQTGKRLINVRTTPDGVTVQFEDGSLANGDLLIGTDGIHSRIRTFIDAQAPIPKLVGLIGVGNHQLAHRRAGGHGAFSSAGVLCHHPVGDHFPGRLAHLQRASPASR